MLRLRTFALCTLLAASAAACGDDTSGASGPTSGGSGGGGTGGDDAGSGGGPSTTVTTGQGTSTGSATTSTGSGDGGAGGSSTGSGDPEADGDDDGFTELEGDCNDQDPDVHPGAPEICNLVDDDCDGEQDEGYDVDGDGFSSCGLDCDDNVATTFPGADELTQGQNGVDDDCNGVVDEPWMDVDGDGFSEAAGDCDDAQPEINPDALEFVGNNADDDCDGVVDEALQPCDGGALDANNPLDYARALGLCNGEVVNAQFVSGPSPSRAILAAYGTYAQQLNVPAEGSKVILLSSGSADATQHDPGVQHDGDGNRFNCIDAPHPAPQDDPGACGFVDPSTVCDVSEVRLEIRVPSNAQSFTYDFQFMSSEYPTFRCSVYDDSFLALLSSQALNGGAPTNISFDQNGNVVSINNGFFDVCYDDNPNVNGGPPNDCDVSPSPDVALAGTGYYPWAGGDSIGAGATNPLTTTSPVVPGEVITLRFIIFDEGDDILDSSVLIDNFRWSLDAADGPSTEE